MLFPTTFDNCTQLANQVQCDTDQDGYGNQCDGDFNQSGAVNSLDYTMFFVPDFQTGTDSGRGTDMNCSGAVNSLDYTMFFVPQLQTAAPPGPSALACAGSVPCAAEPSQQVAFSDLVSNPEAFHSVTDSQGRLHAVYVADESATSHDRLVKYVTQASPVAPLTQQTIATAPQGQSIYRPALAIALDSAGQPCVVWASATGTGPLSHYGCLGPSGLSDADISDKLVRVRLGSIWP